MLENHEDIDIMCERGDVSTESMYRGIGHGPSGARAPVSAINMMPLFMGC